MNRQTRIDAPRKRPIIPRLYDKSKRFLIKVPKPKIPVTNPKTLLIVKSENNSLTSNSRLFGTSNNLLIKIRNRTPNMDMMALKNRFEKKTDAKYLLASFILPCR